MVERVPGPFASTAALLVLDEDLRILSWNEGAERLTGIAALDAVGRPCWDVIAGRDDEGGIVCHCGCSRARLLREGYCMPATMLHARTPKGRRRLSLDTITAPGENGRVFLHVMHDAPPAEPAAGTAQSESQPQLTPRQREILTLLADGMSVKAIARELGLVEPTVRNHIRLLFVALGVHSQLEAVALAHRLRLV